MGDHLSGSVRDPWRSGRWGVTPRKLPLFLPALILFLGCGGEGSGSAREVGSQRPEGHTTEGPAGVFPLEIRDASGRVLELGAPPQRILSLVPSASETLLAIGAENQLVGRTDFDDNTRLAHLPSVGGGLFPNLEAIVAMAPDLVIRFTGDSDSRTPGRLDQMGISHFAIDPKGITAVQGIIRDLGIITGNREGATRVLAQMDSTLAEVRNRVKGREKRKVVYLLGGSPPWVAGPGSFIGDLLVVAGGENAFLDLGEVYGPVNTELFLARQIDLILAAEGAEIVLPETGIPFRTVPQEVEIPGPGLALAAVAMARAIHPEAFR